MGLATLCKSRLKYLNSNLPRHNLSLANLIEICPSPHLPALPGSLYWQSAFDRYHALDAWVIQTSWASGPSVYQTVGSVLQFIEPANNERGIMGCLSLFGTACRSVIEPCVEKGMVN